MDTVLKGSDHYLDYQAKTQPEIPAHLGGFQALADETKIVSGDLAVFTDGTNRVADWVVGEIGYTVAGARAYWDTRRALSFYRNIPVAKQGDTDDRTQAMIRATAAAQLSGPVALSKRGPISMPTDAAGRKATPIATGFLDYFPDAVIAVAQVSKVGNEQHNPGKPLQWDRSKSTDEADTAIRHFLQRGTVDTDGVRHSAKAAWRMLALLQKEIEADADSR